MGLAKRFILTHGHKSIVVLCDYLTSYRISGSKFLNYHNSKNMRFSEFFIFILSKFCPILFFVVANFDFANSLLN